MTPKQESGKLALKGKREGGRGRKRERERFSRPAGNQGTAIEISGNPEQEKGTLMNQSLSTIKSL